MVTQTLRDMRGVQYAQVETELLRDPTITPQCKTLYSLLITYGPTSIFPGHKTLAEALGVSRPTIIKWLQGLRDVGVIDWENRKGTSNWYVILGYKGGVKQALQGVSSPVDRGCQAQLTRSTCTNPDPPIHKDADGLPDELPEQETAPEPAIPANDHSVLDHKDPFTMALHCAEKRDQNGGAPDWAMVGPEGTHRFYPILAAFCTMTHQALSLFTPKQGKRWLTKYEGMASEHSLSPADMLQAHEFLPDKDRGAWYIENHKWASPYNASYEEQLVLAAMQVKGGTITTKNGWSKAMS